MFNICAQIRSVMKFDCLVCGKPASSTHMGMDACRACTVFYKRNHRSRDKLKCGYGKRTCMANSKNNAFNCRKCRIERFETVVRSGTAEGTAPLSPIPQRPHETAMSCTKHEQISAESSRKIAGQSIIDKIRTNHETLSAFRRSTELNLRGIPFDPAEGNENQYELLPSTYRFANEGMKALVVGLFEFASSTFPEFRSLQNSDKWLLIRNYHRCFFWMDGALRSMRRFGTKFDIMFGSYTTIISLEHIDNFFSDCPNQSNAAAAAKTFRSRWLESVPRMRKITNQIDPTEGEFLAMIGLAFWSFEGLQTSDYLEELSSRYRREITTAMTDHYRRTIGEEKGAVRIGDLLCMMQQFKTEEMMLKSDYEVLHLLGAFDHDTLSYQLQVL